MAEPISEAKAGEFVTLTIKGEGCKCITPNLIARFIEYLIDNGLDFKVTRFDVAWDGLDFSPESM